MTAAADGITCNSYACMLRWVLCHGSLTASRTCFELCVIGATMNFGVVIGKLRRDKLMKDILEVCSVMYV